MNKSNKNKSAPSSFLDRVENNVDSGIQLSEDVDRNFRKCSNHVLILLAILTGLTLFISWYILEKERDDSFYLDVSPVVQEKHIDTLENLSIHRILSGTNSPKVTVYFEHQGKHNLISKSYGGLPKNNTSISVHEGQITYNADYSKWKVENKKNEEMLLAIHLENADQLISAAADLVREYRAKKPLQEKPYRKSESKFSGQFFLRGCEILHKKSLAEKAALTEIKAIEVYQGEDFPQCFVQYKNIALPGLQDAYFEMIPQEGPEPYRLKTSSKEKFFNH